MRELGWEPMPWQEQVLEVAYEIDDDGDLVYREIVLIVPRQAGKTSLMLAVQVHRALFFEGNQTSIYTAQTRNDARLKFLDEHVPLLEHSPFSLFFKKRLATGAESILWKNGSIHSIVAPNRKAGHGKSLDLAIIDEAFARDNDELEQGLKPAQITRKSAQLWVISAAGDDKSLYLLDKLKVGRERAKLGLNTESCYFEWSAEDDLPADDPNTWRSCHPAIGFTIGVKAIAADHATMKADEFERAYLARWPLNGGREVVINDLDWSACFDLESIAPNPTVFAFDVSRDSSISSISMAGARSDARTHIEVVDMRPGKDWVAPRLIELLNKYPDAELALDIGSGAGTILPEILRGIKRDSDDFLRLFTANDVAKSSVAFYDAVIEKVLVTTGLQEPLNDAVLHARKRQLGGSWTWERNSTIDMTPLRACSFALWAHKSRIEKKYTWDAM